MSHETLMTIRLAAPVYGLMLFALILLYVAESWTSPPYLSALAPYLEQASWLTMALDGLVTLYVAARLVRWHQGHGLACNRCGCLLGRERPGLRHYGPYRKCLGCQRNTPQQEYVLTGDTN